MFCLLVETSMSGSSYSITYSKKRKFREARRIKKENNEGHIEYKVKIDADEGCHRYHKLVTQMLFRLQEGIGKAVYNLGYRDDGNPQGLTFPKIMKSIDILHKIAKDLDAVVRSVRIFWAYKNKTRYCANVFITKEYVDHVLIPEFN